LCVFPFLSCSRFNTTYKRISLVCLTSCHPFQKQPEVVDISWLKSGAESSKFLDCTIHNAQNSSVFARILSSPHPLILFMPVLFSAVAWYDDESLLPDEIDRPLWSKLEFALWKTITSEDYVGSNGRAEKRILNVWTASTGISTYSNLSFSNVESFIPQCEKYFRTSGM